MWTLRLLVVAVLCAVALSAADRSAATLAEREVRSGGARFEPCTHFSVSCKHTQAFEEFKQRFDRVYADASEEAKRFAIFVQTSRFIEVRFEA